MNHQYYLHHMSFAQYMATLEDLHPTPRIQDLQWTRSQFNQMMRPMMRYINPDGIWVRKHTLCPSWLSYRKTIEDSIRASRQLFTYHNYFPEEADIRIFRQSTVSNDILTRVSTDQGLKSIILAYIIVAITVLVYMEYNIFFKRY